jgi:hypothetical protein
MARMARGLVVNLEQGRGEGGAELCPQALGDDAHYFASQFVACQFLIGKRSVAYFGQ